MQLIVLFRSGFDSSATRFEDDVFLARHHTAAAFAAPPLLLVLGDLAALETFIQNMVTKTLKPARFHPCCWTASLAYGQHTAGPNTAS